MKSEKLITLAIIAGLAIGGYFFYMRFMRSEAEKKMSAFNQALKIWQKKIERAITTLTPGWEKWYRPAGPLREIALKQAQQAAIWQIKINQPELIPPGYQVIDTGEELALLQKFV